MAIRSLKDLYANYPNDTSDGKTAREVIVQSDWLYNAVAFDPVSGDALPQSLSRFLTRLQSPAADRRTLHDRLWRIVDYSADAFVRVVRSLNEQPRTDHARMHVSKVREMDASSFVKLANRTGRTIREKLGRDPFVTSVRHFQSHDILENRLLKAYALRMEELLELRARAFGEPEAELLTDIRNWLVSDDAKGISRWDNLPPNNALLSHRDYRRIWKAWRWLQSLDDDVGRDAENVSEHGRVVSFWNALAQSFAGGNTMADMPIAFDYDSFAVRPQIPGEVVHVKNASCRKVAIGDVEGIPLNAKGIAKGARRDVEMRQVYVDVPVCVDFSSIRPAWTSGCKVCRLDALLVWQRWEMEGVDSVSMSIPEATCVWTNENALTVTIGDLLLPGRVEDGLSEWAAAEFLSILRERFHSREFVWLVPDCVNEFELSTLRRNINKRFGSAMPLPRSMAVVVEKMDGRKIADGHAVTVVDAIGARVYATRLVARKCADDDLAKRVPESCGCYWERQPTVVLEDGEWTLMERLSGVQILDGHLQWLPSVKNGGICNPSEIKKRFPDLSERFAGSEIVFADVEPVCGGLALYERQKRAGDIPLWRDHLPDLDLSASSGNGMIRVHLVSNTTIVPRTGMTVDIPVEATFTLPAGRDEYMFPLYQGMGAARLRYQARLSAKGVFPLREDLPCRLVMRYTYGADSPYELRFTPKAFHPDMPKSFLVEWIPLTVNGDAPGPGFPTVPDLELMRNDGTNREKDLLERLELGLDRLVQYSAFLSSRPSSRRYKQLENPLKWRERDHGGWYAFIGNMYLRSDEFENSDDFKYATEISFDVESESRSSRKRARNVTLGETIPSKFTWTRYLLRTPMAMAFGTMRSREEQGGLAPLLERAAEAAREFYGNEEVAQETRDDLLLMLAYCNSRIPDSGIALLNEVAEGAKKAEFGKFNRYKKAIALSIGDCSEAWQEYLMEKVLSKTSLDEKWTSVAYEILAISLWRSKTLVHRLGKKQIVRILDGLGKAIKRDRARIERYEKADDSGNKDNKTKLGVALNTLCKHLELLLALLRTRESEAPEIRQIIMPGTAYAVNFEAIVGNEAMPIFEKGHRLDSRIRLKLEKPEMFKRTPDLLYALKLYLTGDDGANSIVVSGISEED